MSARRDVSDAVARQLVAMLFDQTATLIAGAVVLAFAAVLGWERSRHVWFLIWAALLIVTLAGRLALEWAYHHRREPAGDFRRWRTAFTIGAWGMGALWGVAAVTIQTHTEPIVQMTTVAVELVIIIGAAARNASFPLAARGQTVLGLVPLFVVFAVKPDPYERIFSFFVGFAFFGAMTIINHWYSQYLRFLRTDEQNCALVHEVRAANEQLAALNHQLEIAATTDSLTGIANRRRFDSCLAEEFARAQRDRSALALIILDIDFFKSFNDLFGHQAGDECLGQVAAVLASSLRRPADLIARYGGEEFAAILPQTDAAGALALAETIRRDVEARGLQSPKSPAGFISVSVGVASLDLPHHRRREDLIRDADNALYAAKDAGRNCVRVAGSTQAVAAATG